MAEINTGTGADGDGGLTPKSGSAYVAGTTILWASLVELGIGEVLKAQAIGVITVLYALSDIQVSLLTGLAEFLSAWVRSWFGGGAVIVREAWSGAAFETFGALAPVVVLAEILVIVYAAYWGVRRL